MAPHEKCVRNDGEWLQENIPPASLRSADGLDRDRRARPPAIVRMATLDGVGRGDLRLVSEHSRLEPLRWRW